MLPVYWVLILFTLIPVFCGMTFIITMLANGERGSARHCR
jgi:hypothetical protein